MRADQQLCAGHLPRDKIEQATKHSLVPLFAGCFIEVPREPESWLRRGGTPRNKAAAETASKAASFLIFLDHFESLLARISFGQKQAGEASIPLLLLRERKRGALAHNLQNWTFAKANSKVIFR